MNVNSLGFSNLVNWLPQSIFFVGLIASICVGLRFNLITKKIVSKIQNIIHSEGREWNFWWDYKKRSDFVFNPENLLREEDSEKLREAKLSLVSHRALLVRYVVIGALCLIGGFALMIASLLMIASFP